MWRDRGPPDAFECRKAVSEEPWLDLCSAALASTLNLQGDASQTLPDPVHFEEVALHVFARVDR